MFSSDLENSFGYTSISLARSRELTWRLKWTKMFIQNKCLLPEWRKCLLKTLKWRKCLLITNFYSLNCLAGLLAGEVTDNLPSSKRALLPHFLQHDVRNKIFMIYHTHFLQHDVRNKVFMIYQTYLIFFKFAPHRSDAVPSLKKDCCLSNNVRDYHFVSQVRSGCLPWPCSYNNRKLCKRNGWFPHIKWSDIFNVMEVIKLCFRGRLQWTQSTTRRTWVLLTRLSTF